MSNYQDVKLVCKQCGKEFNFSAGEQEFFESRGFRAPIRCQDCRKQKRVNVPNPPIQASSGTYEICCSRCAKTTQVPFKPRNPQGILCSDCFETK